MFVYSANGFERNDLVQYGDSMYEYWKCIGISGEVWKV